MFEPLPIKAGELRRFVGQQTEQGKSGPVYTLTVPSEADLLQFDLLAAYHDLDQLSADDYRDLMREIIEDPDGPFDGKPRDNALALLDEVEQQHIISMTERDYEFPKDLQAKFGRLQRRLKRESSDYRVLLEQAKHRSFARLQASGRWLLVEIDGEPVLKDEGLVVPEVWDEISTDDRALIVQMALRLQSPSQAMAKNLEARPGLSDAAATTPVDPVEKESDKTAAKPRRSRSKPAKSSGKATRATRSRKAVSS